MHETFPGASVIDRIEATFIELAREVNSASGAARNSWLFYMALLAYFFIALAGVTHKDLLLNAPVELPLLQVKIGLRAFFLFAPLILVLMHLGILLQHVMLSRKLRDLHARVTRFEGSGMHRTHRIRMQLHSYHYTQAIAGPYRSPLFAFFLHVMTWVTLGLLPLLLLLDFQVTFLPAHDLNVTWAHRIYLTSLLTVMLIFGVFMRFPEKSFLGGFGANILKHPGSLTGTLIVCLAALFFSFCVATVPDERMDRAMRAIPAARLAVPQGYDPALGAALAGERHAFWPTAVLFEGGVDHLSGRPQSIFGRNLVVTDADLVPDGGDNRGEVSISLRRRDLRYATFDRSDLHQADLTGAILTGASLREADLRGVKAEQADLQNADLRKTRLDHAVLSGGVALPANLRFARLEQANLEGADLRSAEIEGAALSGAKVKGAKLDEDDMKEAERQGAIF